jgi:hypothetical protein
MSFRVINGFSDLTVSTSFQPSSTATQRFVQQYEQMLEDMLDGNNDAAGESVSRQVAIDHANLKLYDKSCTSPLLSLPSMLAELRTSLGGCHSLGVSPCFLDGNTTSTIPHKHDPRQKQAFEFGCADGSGQGSRRGSHVYEINTWLWNFGRPQPRIDGILVTKTETIRRQSRSETSRRATKSRKARKRAVDQI